ncbi:MAG: divalent-cation tolerance protein CutA [Candidatus Hodarchaeota archaeon]
MRYYIFFVTVPNLEEGKKIAKHLVESKYAACVNIIQNILSIYRWKGRIEDANEHLLLIKTTERNSKQLIEKINEIHSYDTPECIGVEIEKGSEKYLNWIDENIK